MNAGSPLACIFLPQSFPATPPAFPSNYHRNSETLPSEQSRNCFSLQRGTEMSTLGNGQ